MKFPDNEGDASNRDIDNYSAYNLPSCQLQVPRQVVETTLELFKPYSKRRHEACCFWYGPRDESGGGLVQAIVIPRQRNTWGNYNVTAETMAIISSCTRQYGWKNLCQIHTHPGRSVMHSWYDDENANSQKSLSLVFPLYGVWTNVWPRGIGVHEYQNSIWHKLDDKNAARRVVLVSANQPVSLVDVR